MNHQPDPDTVAAYMEGDCHAFAVALARRTGWPLAALVDDGRRYTPGSDFPTIAHVVVRSPDDRLLDVRGRHRLDDLKAQYPDLLTPRLYHFDGEHELLAEWSGESDDLPLHALSQDDLADADAAVLDVYPALAAQT